MQRNYSIRGSYFEELDFFRASMLKFLSAMLSERKETRKKFSNIRKSENRSSNRNMQYRSITILPRKTVLQTKL